MTWWTKTIEFLSIIFKWFTKNRKKKLPYSKVCIGEYKNDKIAMAIHANIVLLENTQPHIDEFLDRVSLGKPYCSKCNLEFALLRTDWVANYGQIGYKCEICNAEYKITKNNLLKVMKSFIREDYDGAWKKYKNEIRKMTKGKEKKYKVV